MPAAFPLVAGYAASALFGGGVIGAIAGLGAAVAVREIVGTSSNSSTPEPAPTPAPLPPPPAIIPSLTAATSLSASSYEARVSPTQMTQQPITPHRIIYGETQVGGPLVYTRLRAPSGSNKRDILHLVQVLAAHEVQDITAVSFGNTDIKMDANGNPTVAPWKNGAAYYAKLYKHLGAADQNADSVLVANSGGEWTNAHRLRGRAYLHAQLTWSATAYPNGLPNISAKVKGRKIFDPRTNTTAWSDNAALCILDFMKAPFGLNCTDDEIDLNSFIAAANICDETVARPDGNEKRYTCNGTIDLNNSPVAILPSLLSSCAGRLTCTSGIWRLFAGAYYPPLDGLDDGDLRDPVTVHPQRSLRELINTVGGTFISPAAYGQPTDYPPVTVAAYQTLDGNIKVKRTLDLPFTNSPYMAQRIAKITLESNRKQLSVEFPANLAGLRFVAGQTISVTLSRFGITSRPMIVAGWRMSDSMGVDLSLVEDGASIYEMAVGDMITADTLPPITLPSNASVPPATPTGLTAVVSGSNVLLTWSQVEESDFDHFEIWEATTSNLSNASLIAQCSQTNWIKQGLLPNSSRTWWIRAVDRQHNNSNYSTSASVTMPGSQAFPIILG
ncbi:Fibronectin type-III domain-containing protein [Azospirillaceae bacterium]